MARSLSDLGDSLPRGSRFFDRLREEPKAMGGPSLFNEKDREICPNPAFPPSISPKSNRLPVNDLTGLSLWINTVNASSPTMFYTGLWGLINLALYFGKAEWYIETVYRQS
jgi:hypothetical protein